jgi:DNA-directed RNA polymerase subunit RPC12/RpoP
MKKVTVKCVNCGAEARVKSLPPKARCRSCGEGTLVLK